MPKLFAIPTYVTYPDQKVGLAEKATVADWRLIWDGAIEGNDKYTLRLFRAATLVLQLAEHHGLTENDVPLYWFEPAQSDEAQIARAALVPLHR